MEAMDVDLPAALPTPIQLLFSLSIPIVTHPSLRPPADRLTPTGITSTARSFPTRPPNDASFLLHSALRREQASADPRIAADPSLSGVTFVDNTPILQPLLLRRLAHHLSDQPVSQAFFDVWTTMREGIQALSGHIALKRETSKTGYTVTTILAMLNFFMSHAPNFRTQTMPDGGNVADYLRGAHMGDAPGGVSALADFAGYRYELDTESARSIELLCFVGEDKPKFSRQRQQDFSLAAIAINMRGDRGYRIYLDPAAIAPPADTSVTADARSAASPAGTGTSAPPVVPGLQFKCTHADSVQSEVHVHVQGVDELFLNQTRWLVEWGHNAVRIWYHISPTKIWTTTPVDVQVGPNALSVPALLLAIMLPPSAEAEERTLVETTIPSFSDLMRLWGNVVDQRPQSRATGLVNQTPNHIRTSDAPQMRSGQVESVNENTSTLPSTSGTAITQPSRYDDDNSAHAAPDRVLISASASCLFGTPHQPYDDQRRSFPAFALISFVTAALETRLRTRVETQPRDDDTYAEALVVLQALSQGRFKQVSEEEESTRSPPRKSQVSLVSIATPPSSNDGSPPRPSGINGVAQRQPSRSDRLGSAHRPTPLTTGSHLPTVTHAHAHVDDTRSLTLPPTPTSPPSALATLLVSRYMARGAVGHVFEAFFIAADPNPNHKSKPKTAVPLIIKVCTEKEPLEREYGAYRSLGKAGLQGTVVPFCLGLFTSMPTDADADVDHGRCSSISGGKPRPIWVLVLEHAGEESVGVRCPSLRYMTAFEKRAVLEAYRRLDAAGIVHGDIATRHIYRDRTAVEPTDHSDGTSRSMSCGVRLVDFDRSVVDASRADLWQQARDVEDALGLPTGAF